ncbi:hypothetical protein PIB30_072445 [Stylosanthes scabra]|uniref:Uncharacterized protein n=1 Tax=Stylosanthes scabra TaxID=79078 RepID=A0ABU6TNQ8_9FABA|nr:hypothetical protein [Stylosanthes scabra]
MAKGNKGCAMGIDLGTTFSCVGVWLHQESRVEILTNQQGKRTTPSVVAFTNTDMLIGEAARNQAATNPENTIFGAKRLIGRKCSDPTVKNDSKTLPFKVVADSDDEPKFVVRHRFEEKKFSAESISCKIVEHMGEIATGFMEQAVKKAVITVPAHFNDSQRQATKRAAAHAGLDVLRIINEPTAAAIAYGLYKRANSVDERNIFVFDLGGGTLDVSLLSIKHNVFIVKATAGDTHLGGEDFNNNLLHHFMKRFNTKHNKDMSKDPRALSRLRAECERVKQDLSFSKEVNVHVDALFQGIDFSDKITQAKFEDLNKELFENCKKIVEKCFIDAKIDRSSVHDVVLVGGSSRIPKVKQILQEFFPAKAIHNSINPDEAIAHGAAYLAAMLNEDIKNAPKLVLSDVNPLSFGTDVRGDVISVLIPRNTPIPVTKTRTYFTTKDNQSAMTFKVYEGERKKASDNNLLGSLRLTGLPSAPRGYVVKLSYTIDENGILSASAVDEKTNKKCNRVITDDDKGRLSTDEIAEMIQNAEIFKAEDEEHVKKANARNALDDYVYEMEKALKDNHVNSKLSSEDKGKIKHAIDEAKKVIGAKLDEQDKNVFKDHLKTVKSVFEPIKKKIG